VMPLVSILIPAYRAERWICETIKSALRQTWPNKEIIVVDDGSPDNTLAVAKRFESKMVKVVTQRHTGACGARNKALSLAQGTHIQWLDADDLLAPDKISRSLARSDSRSDSRVLLTSAFGTFFFRYQRARFEPNALGQDLSPVEWMVTRFTKNLWINPAAWLISRRLSDLAGPWDQRISPSGDDDGEYICRVVGASEKVKFVPEAKCYYREGSSSSLSKRRSDGAYEALLLSTKLCVSHLLSLEDSARTRAACIELLENRLWHFHPEKRDLIEQLEELARKLGAQHPLQLRETWKYSLVGRYFGWSSAKTGRRMVSTIRIAAAKNWDRLLYAALST
jgi:glycosyltransferase involved in cell wall biosynthesis